MLGTVHLVDDDEQVRRSTELLLRTYIYEVPSYASGNVFLADFKPRPPRCALINYGMPGYSGIEVTEAIRAKGWRVPVILCSGTVDPNEGIALAQAHAVKFLQKAYPPDDLLVAVESAIYKRDWEPLL